MGTLTVITEPTIEPVTLEEAKIAIGLGDDDSQDGRVDGHIRTARMFAEDFCDLRIMTQTVERSYDGWPSFIIDLNVWPLASIDSVKYDDTASPVAEQTLVVNTDYYADTTFEGGRVGTINGWPSVASKFNPVRIRMTAGYTTQALVPEGLKDGIKAYVVFLFEDNCDMKQVAMDILRGYRRKI